MAGFLSPASDGAIARQAPMLFVFLPAFQFRVIHESKRWRKARRGPSPSRVHGPNRLYLGRLDASSASA